MIPVFKNKVNECINTGWFGQGILIWEYMLTKFVEFQLSEVSKNKN